MYNIVYTRKYQLRIFYEIKWKDSNSCLVIYLFENPSRAQLLKMCGKTGNIRHYLWDGFGIKNFDIFFAKRKKKLKIISDHMRQY